MEKSDATMHVVRNLGFNGNQTCKNKCVKFTENVIKDFLVKNEET